MVAVAREGHTSAKDAFSEPEIALCPHNSAMPLATKFRRAANVHSGAATISTTNFYSSVDGPAIHFRQPLISVFDKGDPEAALKGCSIGVRRRSGPRATDEHCSVAECSEI